MTPEGYCRPVPNDFLLVIGDREPLAWILTEEAMAFPAHRLREVSGIERGDRFFLYTTRGCFHNPTNGRGRIIGEAEVMSTVSSLHQPVTFDGSTFPLGCKIRLIALALRGEGIEMGSVVEKLHLFPSPHAWGCRLRRVIVPLDKHDAGMVRRRLSRVVRPPEESLRGYIVGTTFDKLVRVQ